MSYSDDGGRTWSTAAEISGSNPSCTYQETGDDGECDEDQFSIPEFGPDGALYVHFLNGQNEAAWEVDFDFDSQIMVTKSTTTGAQFGAPTHVIAARGRPQRHAVLGHRPADSLGASDPLDGGGQHLSRIPPTLTT